MMSLATAALMTVMLLFILGWVVVCVAVGVAATARGRSMVVWALFSLVFSPVLGLLLLLVLPNRRYDLLVRAPANP